MKEIYISSTFLDLEECRKVVYKVIQMMGFHSVGMEDYVASDQRPLDKCLDDVRKADVYVGIVAWRYGFIPMPTAGEKSITHFEYEVARDLEKPRLIFLLDKTAPWPPIWIDSVTGESHGGELVKLFRGELDRERVVSYFSNPNELANLVSVSLHKVFNPGSNLPVDVYLADDHQEVIDSWVRLLKLDKLINVIGSSTKIRQVQKDIDRLNVDVLLLDLKWGRDTKAGWMAIKRIKAQWPLTKIIAITVHEELFGDALYAGADAILLKTFRSEQLLDLIKALSTRSRS